MPTSKDDRNTGITSAIREKLNFQDERLWKRFSARRLELIDAMHLSSKKASDQKDEIRKVAEILRTEFMYGLLYHSAFDKLVRAAVQSVRRNRKRGPKATRSGPKRQAILAIATNEDEEKGHQLSVSGNSEQPSGFLSEIALLHTDAHDSVYDMSYCTRKEFTHKDKSRNAVDSIIRPAKLDTLNTKPSLPPLLTLQTEQRHLENERLFRSAQQSLLQLIKRSKVCYTVPLRPNNDHRCELGRVALIAVTTFMFETSFLNLNEFSLDYLKAKLSHNGFIAKFYHQLDQDSSSGQLDEQTAVTTLQILIGSCILDFGFDAVIYKVKKALYHLILLEYPLILLKCTPFKQDQNGLTSPRDFHDEHLLTSLAKAPADILNYKPLVHIDNFVPKPEQDEEYHLRTESAGTANEKRKFVTLRFLSTTLNFSYPMHNSAPPRFTELMENASQAFELNRNQSFGLRNSKTGDIIQTDFLLEKLFVNDTSVELEIYSQGFQAMPLYKLTSTVNSSSDRSKIMLPLPITPKSPPIVSNSRKESISVHQTPIQPRFQPLL